MGLRGPIANGATTLADDAMPTPTHPADLHPKLQYEWEQYWESDVARAADGVDIPMVERLWLYRDELFRSQLAWNLMGDTDRWIEPTRNRNTVVAHPMVRRMEKLESQIVTLENLLGLSPLSRARLGIELGQAQLTWKQVEATARGDADIIDAGARVIE